MNVEWMLLLLMAFPPEAQKFYPDDPVLVDGALLDVAEKPAELELSDLYDRFSHIFKDTGKSPLGTEAQSVNTLDEAVDGDWFRTGTARSA
jgi:hypothetical protein